MNPRREKAQQAENKTSNGETPVRNKKKKKLYKNWHRRPRKRPLTKRWNECEIASLTGGNIENAEQKEVATRLER